MLRLMDSLKGGHPHLKEDTLDKDFHSKATHNNKEVSHKEVFLDSRALLRCHLRQDLGFQQT
jgi:hypothetical protein